MLKRRWYDDDPIVSLAVELLQSSCRVEQLRIVRKIATMLIHVDSLERLKEKSGDPRTVVYLFPERKRKKLEEGTLCLLEILKRLPTHLRTEMALNIILLHPNPMNAKLLTQSFIQPIREAFLDYQSSL